MTRPLVVAVANQKGGVAKTTSVACIGVALHELGARVLLVDLDPQACLTFSLGLDPEHLPLSVHDVLLGRVTATMARVTTAEGPDLLPATIELSGAEASLASRIGREQILRLALGELAEVAGQTPPGGSGYDVILLDCPPSLGLLTVNALTAADEVIIPLQCESLSHRGVGQLLDTVHDVQRLTNPKLTVRGVLPTLYDPRTAHARAVLADIGTRYGLRVLHPPVHKSIRFAEAPAAGRTVLSGPNKPPGAAAYRVVARGLLGLPELEPSSGVRGPESSARPPEPGPTLDLTAAEERRAPAAALPVGWSGV